MTIPTTDPQIRRPADPQRARHARAVLTRVCRGLPTPTLARLIATIGPIETVARLRGDAATAQQCGVNPGGDRAGDDDRAARDLAHTAVRGARLLTPEDPDWPTGAVMGWQDATGSLATAVEPVGLWVRGPAALTSVELAVVGSRAASDYGQWVARDWAAALTEAGVSIVTGGELGVAAAALRGALAADGTPVAVTASGIDTPHPPANQHLLDAVAERGAVVTPYPPGQTPTRGSRHVRLRTIAALATSGTLIVEAGARSSALHSAHAAREQHRRVLVVPGPVTSAVSGGSHRLAREPGARLVGTVADVLADIASA